ncbi:hypothetical protein B296_00049084 [Ensete ventricosum]|uniref:Uncharacterized protein n=1 Tax=Ensete ventricosum TaxID=4639 RepID=A0A426Y3V4_ENSVE|nr:hypothetical protein B296_00049084 [Ensete ventricosum]
MLNSFFCCRVRGISFCRREGATVVEMLTTRRGSGFRRATGSDEEEVGAAGSGKQRGPAGVAAAADDSWTRLRQRWLQREEDEEGTTGGDCKGRWLQASPSVARRWGGRMGDGDAIEGWKAAAAREEKEAAGVRQGLRQWMAGVAGRRWREQQQRCWMARVPAAGEQRGSACGNSGREERQQ